MAIKNNKYLLEFIWSNTEDTDDSDMDDNSDDDNEGDDDIKSDDDIEVSDNEDEEQQFKIEKVLRTKGQGVQKNAWSNGSIGLRDSILGSRRVISRNLNEHVYKRR